MNNAPLGNDMDLRNPYDSHLICEDCGKIFYSCLEELICPECQDFADYEDEFIKK